MVRDIIKWVTDELESFVIPVAALKETEAFDVKISKAGIAEADCGPIKIKGCSRDGMLIVGTLSCKGAGSGDAYNCTLEPLLKESQGNMTAFVHWEGETAPVKLNVENGDVYEVFVN